MSVKNNRRRGKDFERHVARELGGRRLGTLGKVDVITDDYVVSVGDINPRLAVECKSRQRLPALIRDAISQAERYAGGDIPAVCLHETDRPHDDDLMVLKLKDFVSILLALKRLNGDDHATREK